MTEVTAAFHCWQVYFEKVLTLTIFNQYFPPSVRKNCFNLQWASCFRAVSENAQITVHPRIQQESQKQKKMISGSKSLIIRSRRNIHQNLLSDPARNRIRVVQCVAQSPLWYAGDLANLGLCQATLPHQFFDLKIFRMNIFCTRIPRGTMENIIIPGHN